MVPITLIIIVQGIVFGAFSSFIAKEKNRDEAGWFLFGFLFSFIALLALIAVPKLDNPTEETKPTIPPIKEAAPPKINCWTCSNYQEKSWDRSAGKCTLHKRNTYASDTCQQHSHKPNIA